MDHVLGHISRDVACPLGERFQIHRLDDLGCGSLDLGQGIAAGLADEVLVTQDSTAPGGGKEVKNELEGAPGCSTTCS